MLTTQYLDEAEHLADQIVVLDRGRVVAEGTPTELKAASATNVSSSQRRTAKRSTGSSRRAIRSTRRWIPTNSSWRSRPTGAPRACATSLDRVDPDGSLIDRFDLRGATLDDVFLAVTGEGVMARG